MVGEVWLPVLACLVILNVWCVNGQDVSVSGGFRWDGIVSQAGNGSGSNQLCYKWNVQFMKPRDVLLSLTINTLAGGMALQIIKYTDKSTGDKQGQTHTGGGNQIEVAFANCTGIDVIFVVNTSCSNGSDVNIAYFSLPEVLHPPNDVPCQPLPCPSAPSMFQLPKTMGRRCYCKGWLLGKPCSGNCTSCPSDFYGEICNLKTVNNSSKPSTVVSPTIRTTNNPSTSGSSSKAKTMLSTMHTQSSYPTNGTTNESSSGGSSSIVGIAAGVGGGILLIILIVVLIVLYLRSQSKQWRNPQAPQSQYSWNAVYNTGPRNPVESKNSKSKLINSKNSDKSKRHSDGSYTYPIVADSENKQSSTNGYADPSTQLQEDEPFWQPSQSVERLYAQFEGKRFRILERSVVELEKEIGAGEFGNVSRGSLKDGNGHETVAVKTLISDSPEDKVRFLREAAIMGQFKHVNVVALKGVVLQGEPLMIVLEFMAKGDLRAHLQAVKESHRCNVQGYNKTLLNMCRDIVSGMAYLSKKCFIHRDLAIRNILLDSKFTCKIGDFGLARDLTNSDYYMTHGGRLPVRWTAPEAIVYRKYSNASDVWSFGIVMYEIWSVGERPYGSTWTNNFVLECLQKGYRLPPPPGCPRPIYELMIACWHSNHHERPTFIDVGASLCVDDKLLLVNESSMEPIRGKLGDPIDSVVDLYMDLQGAYQKS